MQIESVLLKTWYCEERKKLEDSQAFKREAYLKAIDVRSEIINKIQKEDLQNLKEKGYISKEVKLTLLSDRGKELSMKNGIINMGISDSKELPKTWEEISAIESGRKNIYVQYFYQLKKVNKIEEELKKRKLNFEKIYEEYKKNIT
ncbi:MAG: hypothetical protein NG740_00945 [Omnitrophica bacterium]|nr:hypothetical protein [Candidatus Omnitrophota bacterium]